MTTTTRFDDVCTGVVLSGYCELSARATGPAEVSEDRMSEDGLTDVRAYARVNEVSGTYPYRSPHLTQLSLGPSSRLLSPLRFIPLSHARLSFRFLCVPGSLFSPHRLFLLFYFFFPSSYSSSSFSYYRLLLLFLVFLLLLFHRLFLRHPRLFLTSFAFLSLSCLTFDLPLIGEHLRKILFLKI